MSELKIKTNTRGYGEVFLDDIPLKNVVKSIDLHIPAGGISSARIELIPFAIEISAEIPEVDLIVGGRTFRVKERT